MHRFFADGWSWLCHDHPPALIGTSFFAYGRAEEDKDGFFLLPQAKTAIAACANTPTAQVMRIIPLGPARGCARCGILEPAHWNCNMECKGDPALTRIHNFSAGPAVLPLAVLEQARAELSDYQGRGMSIMEMSHRSSEYAAINAEAEKRAKTLLGLGDDYRVLFVQGGASLQFAMLPMNFLPANGTADYILTGSWSDKALAEARRFGQAHVAASTKEEKYRRIPGPAEIRLSEQPAYVHITSNNTIYGTQWAELPAFANVPLAADMSSDIFSRPFDATKFALIYAGAQKNVGPAGVTLVIVRQSWLEAAADTPPMLSYANYAGNDSLYNTPPTFAVYLVNLVLGWIEELGGLPAMAERNRRKAATVYAAIDASGGFYRGHADPAARSQMNVTFRLPDEALEKQFVAESKAAGMVGLNGHRSVGGVRASLYNALEPESCDTLAAFMAEFARKNG
jgi:phosphoserine aminotransferase